MIASPTTIPAVKLQLETLFKAAVTEPTEVWGFETAEDHQVEENVYIGDVRGQRAFKYIGPVSSNGRQETYTITCTVDVYRQGTDGPGVEARMWEIVQQLELAVAENRTLPGTKADYGIADSFQQSTRGSADGVVASYVMGITVTARI